MKKTNLTTAEAISSAASYIKSRQFYRQFYFSHPHWIAQLMVILPLWLIFSALVGGGEIGFVFAVIGNLIFNMALVVRAFRQPYYVPDPVYECGKLINPATGFVVPNDSLTGLDTSGNRYGVNLKTGVNLTTNYQVASPGGVNPKTGLPIAMAADGTSLGKDISGNAIGERNFSDNYLLNAAVFSGISYGVTSFSDDGYHFDRFSMEDNTTSNQGAHNFDDFYSHSNSMVIVNPATGLTMLNNDIGSVDVGGSPYGFDSYHMVDDNYHNTTETWSQDINTTHTWDNN